MFDWDTAGQEFEQMLGRDYALVGWDGRADLPLHNIRIPITRHELDRGPGLAFWEGAAQLYVHLRRRYPPDQYPIMRYRMPGRSDGATDLFGDRSGLYDILARLNRHGAVHDLGELSRRTGHGRGFYAWEGATYCESVPISILIVRDPGNPDLLTAHFFILAESYPLHRLQGRQL